MYLVRRVIPRQNIHFFSNQYGANYRLPLLFAATNNAPTRMISLSKVSREQISVVAPHMAESISEGIIAALPCSVGDFVAADEEIATVETDKIDVSINAPKASIVVEYYVAEGDVVVVGQKIATLERMEEGEIPQTPTATFEPISARGELKTPPTAVKAFLEKNQPPHPHSSPIIQVTSPNHASDPTVTEMYRTPPRPETCSHTSPNAFIRGERLERMPRIRKTIATRLKKSQNLTAPLTAIQRLDMSSIIHWRKLYKQAILEKHNVRLGYMGAFTKAATLAALQIPEINASMDYERGFIAYRDYVDISIAVSTPKGLVTPVIKNCEKLDILNIEREVARVAKMARDSKLTMQDLEGGNFTISNPGIFGSMFGTPLINYPQSAVFNINSIKDEPVVVHGEVKIRPMMYITLTYDHRLIDGREAAEFLNMIKANIESPEKMLLPLGPQ